MKLSLKRISRMLPVTKIDGHGVWLVGYKAKPGSRKSHQEVTLTKPRLLKTIKAEEVPDSCKAITHHTRS